MTRTTPAAASGAAPGTPAGPGPGRAGRADRSGRSGRSDRSGRYGPASRRLPLFAAAGLSLAAGLAGGLARLGPTGGAGGGAGGRTGGSLTDAAAQHGLLMALGFLGTLIAMERAVALGRAWGYASPALAALGALALATGQGAGRLLLTAAAAWLVAVYLALLARRAGLDAPRPTPAHTGATHGPATQGSAAQVRTAQSSAAQVRTAESSATQVRTAQSSATHGRTTQSSAAHGRTAQSSSAAQVGSTQNCTARTRAEQAPTSPPAAVPEAASAEGRGAAALRRPHHPHRFPVPEAVQLAGAAGWYGAGMLLLAGRPVGDTVPWLVAFLVLTVAGERLELARVAFAGRGGALLAAAGVLAAGTAVSVWQPDAGWRTSGAGMLALAGWLARHDVARRTVRAGGLPRYAACCLLAGYAWLVLAGAVWLAVGRPPGSDTYDVALHAVFLGFVVSMVLGHAPVILPAVARVRLPYRPVLYLPLAVLHGALAVRVAGDLAGAPALHTAGGWLTAAALPLFAACAVVAARTTAGTRAGARAGATGVESTAGACRAPARPRSTRPQHEES